MTIKRVELVLLIVVAVLGVCMIAQSQPADQGGGGGNGGGRGGRGGDWRERGNTFMKEGMGATDEEWKVLQPRVEKVFSLSMQARGFGGMGMGRRGGGGGDQAGAADRPPESDAMKAGRELRETLNDKSSSTDAVKAKLEALRAARAKAKEQLATAQKELRDVVSVKQEAFLVMMGLLD